MGDWGKRIKIIFADAGGGSTVYDVKSSELVSAFRVREDTYGTYLYPSSVTIGDNPNEIFLNFDDFNQSPPPWTIQYLGGTSMRGKDLPVEAFDIQIDLKNLNRKGDYEYIELASVEVAGNITIGFDGKLYHAEYINLTVVPTGTNALLIFRKAYNREYIEISTVTVAGTYADVNGIPV